MGEALSFLFLFERPNFKPNFLNLVKAKGYIDKDSFPPELARIGNKFKINYKTVAISKV